MQNKRERLARLSGRLGILKWLERLASSRPGLVVLTYHRIAEPGGDRFYDPVISATPAMFRAQVETIARTMPILTLEEALDRIATGQGGRGLEALITFDDGYRDNFEIAAPILRELGIPSTFFLPSDFLDAPRLPWWDDVARIVKSARERRFSAVIDGSTIAIDLDATPQAEAIHWIIAAFLDDRIRDASSFLTRLAESAGVDDDREALARGLFASWDDVRREVGSSGSGFAVGSHGKSHRKLAGLDTDAQFDELTESKRIIEDRLGRRVEALAYPYGWPGAFGEETEALAERAGYRAAFSAIEGINRPGARDRFALRRLNVGSGDSAVLLRARAALHATIGRSLL